MKHVRRTSLLVIVAASVIVSAARFFLLFGTNKRRKFRLPWTWGEIDDHNDNNNSVDTVKKPRKNKHPTKATNSMQEKSTMNDESSSSKKMKWKPTQQER